MFTCGYHLVLKVWACFSSLFFWLLFIHHIVCIGRKRKKQDKIPKMLAIYTAYFCIPATAISGRQHLQSAATGTVLIPCTRTATGQRSFFFSQSMDQPHGTVCHQHCTQIIGPVGERLQAGTEDIPVLDCPAPLRRLRDSGAGYKYPDLLTFQWFCINFFRVKVR